MKRLLQKHHNLVLTNLMDKYDKRCHLYQNAINNKANGQQELNSIKENRDEFLAVNIG
jgi:hypothetical protein